MFELGIDFDLCGNNHKGSLRLDFSSNIFDSIVDYIHRECLNSKPIHTLDDVYTSHTLNSHEMDREVATVIRDAEPYINHVEQYENDFEQLKTMFSNMSLSVRSVDQCDINSLISDLNDSVQSHSDFLRLHEKISIEELETIESFTVSLIDKIREHESLHPQFSRETYDLNNCTFEEAIKYYNKNHEMISRSQESIKRILSHSIVDSVNKDIIIEQDSSVSTRTDLRTNQTFSQEEIKIIEAYKSMTEETSTISPMIKSMFLSALGEAYSEFRDYEQSQKYFEFCQQILSNTFGGSSKEYQESVNYSRSFQCPK